MGGFHIVHLAALGEVLAIGVLAPDAPLKRVVVVGHHVETACGSHVLFVEVEGATAVGDGHRVVEHLVLKVLAGTDRGDHIGDLAIQHHIGHVSLGDVERLVSLVELFVERGADTVAGPCLAHIMSAAQGKFLRQVLQSLVFVEQTFGVGYVDYTFVGERLFIGDCIAFYLAVDHHADSQGSLALVER